MLIRLVDVYMFYLDASTHRDYNLESVSDCTYYETGHPPTPSPSVSPKPSTSPTPGPTVSPTLGPTPKVVADAATATTVGVLAAGAAGVAALL